MRKLLNSYATSAICYLFYSFVVVVVVMFYASISTLWTKFFEVVFFYLFYSFVVVVVVVVIFYASISTLWTKLFPSFVCICFIHSFLLLLSRLFYAVFLHSGQSFPELVCLLSCEWFVAEVARQVRRKYSDNARIWSRLLG